MMTDSVTDYNFLQIVSQTTTPSITLLSRKRFRPIASIEVGYLRKHLVNDVYVNAKYT